MKLATPKLLIVDDNSANRIVLKDILSEMPLDLVEAESGQEALRQVLLQEFCAILMDVNMPGMDGIETTRLILEHLDEHPVPIIFLTACNDSQSIRNCYQAGGIDFVTKPIDEDILLAKISILNDLYLKQQRILHLKEQSEILIESAGEGFVGFNENFEVTFVNSIAACMWMSTKDDLIGNSIIPFVFDSNGKDKWQQSPIFEAFEHQQNYQSDTGLFYPANGDPLPVLYTISPIIRQEQLQGGVLVFQDVTERKRTEAELLKLAQYDPLTNLHNRAMFQSLLEQSVTSAERYHHSIALHFIDLDNFKDVNDTLGHDAGDSLIHSAAQRIQHCLRDADMVARLGGDEFGVIQRLDSNEEINAAILAKRLVESLQTPFLLGENQAFVGCSVGIALYPAHASNCSELVKHADTAMYKSKHLGRNQYQFFSKQMQDQISTHMSFVTALKNALHNKEISIVYQPQVDLEARCVTGVEALMRWQHPRLGNVSPDVFIPIAEQSGLINELGRWILYEACRQAQEWNFALDVKTPSLHIAINISVCQMAQGKLATMIHKVLESTGISADMVKLEITESVLMENPTQSIEEIRKINQLGVEVAIDDFGTGYSSLSYLGVLPLRCLKIDRSFVTDICNHSTNQKIVLSILSLARSLGYEVIAEGVETEEELNFLWHNGCRQIQGYFFSEPLPSNDVAAFVADTDGTLSDKIHHAINCRVEDSLDALPALHQNSKASSAAEKQNNRDHLQ